MTKRQAELITKHGYQLKEIFGVSGEPIPLCKKLHRIETALHNATTAYCNGAMEMETLDALCEKALARVDKILGYRAKNIPVFVNRDPRGYALKIDDTYVRDHNVNIHRDWGGYGIICPEID